MIIRRIIDALIRRRAPQYRGWQDTDWLDEAWEMPAPKPGVTAKDTLSALLPKLQPWQEELLRTFGWVVQNGMLLEHRRPEDATISIHNEEPVPSGLTVFGIPVRLDPTVRPGEVHVVDAYAFPRIRAIHTQLPDGGWTVETVNEDAEQIAADLRNRRRIR